MKKAAPAPRQNAEAELAGFIDKFTPEMARAIRAVRVALRKRLPTANELVYDNYNFFVIGIVRLSGRRIVLLNWWPMRTACGSPSIGAPNSPILPEFCSAAAIRTDSYDSKARAI